MRDLHHHLGNRRVDLPRHDGGSGGKRRKLDLHKARAGTRTHHPEILREFRERAGDFFHDTRDRHRGVTVLEPVKEVLHRLDLFAVILRNKPVERFLVPRRGGESGSDRGAAHHDLKALGADVFQLPDKTPERGGVA